MIVPSVPSHYPPLFPWLVGRTSALVDVPAWRLLGPAEAITLSFAVVAGFALWRLLVPGPLALALTLPVLLSYSLPEKAYEIVALAVLTPWVLAIRRAPRGRRLHWLGRPDRRSQHRAVLGVHHVRGLGNRGPDRAHLAGEPAARPVRPSRRADGGSGRGRRLLVPRALPGLGAAASVEARSTTCTRGAGL